MQLGQLFEQKIISTFHKFIMINYLYSLPTTAATNVDQNTTGPSRAMYIIELTNKFK